MLLIVPASNELAKKNFERTIKSSWSLDRLLKLSIELPSELITKLKGTHEFKIWGMVPSLRNIWDKIKEGTIVMFYQDGYITCWGTIFAKLKSRDLALKLWGSINGETWELIYFIRNLKWIKISWRIICKKLGYSDGYIPRGHQLVREDRYANIETFLKTLSLSTISASFTRTPYFLQGLVYCHTPSEYLEVLGAIIKEFKKKDTCSKSDVVNSISELLTHKKLPEDLTNILFHDLYYLGILKLKPDSAWENKTQKEISEILPMIPIYVDEQHTGAVALINAIYLSNTPCTSILKRLLHEGQDCFEEIINEIAKADVSMSRDEISKLLEMELRLVEECKKLVSDIPRLLLPIESWRL